MTSKLFHKTEQYNPMNLGKSINIQNRTLVYTQASARVTFQIYGVCNFTGIVLDVHILFLNLHRGFIRTGVLILGTLLALNTVILLSS